ncbi:Tfx family DNA-binding protein [Thermoplasmatales archaeon AK]|nr:Tfx family DNA-binding protein [Thermoplasmatales archaeon AK]
MKTASGRRSKRYLFTDKQIDIMRLLSEGKSRLEVAEHIGTTVQNVMILERRFNRNAEIAANSLKLLRDLDFAASAKITAGTHLLDAGMTVIRVADSMGISLRHNAVTLVSEIRSYLGGDVRKGIINREIEVLILPSGNILVL